MKPTLAWQAGKRVLLFPGFSPLFVDFSATALHQRRTAGKDLALVRAIKPQPGLKIIDATAGWGRDALVLAHHGAEVLMLERQPLMAALLEDGLARIEDDSPLKTRLSFCAEDALSYLQRLKPLDYPDIIYLDPMHPTREKSALVKKEMQVLQSLLGADLDAKALLTLALQRAKKRVVVKWPTRQPALSKPHFSFAGKTVRFDCYEVFVTNTC